ncbi:MAG: radical SAM protein [Planctomycetota bacterium]
MARKSCRILLVNPPYTKVTYEDVDRKAGALQNPVLSLATVAAPLIEDGHDVRIADMDLENEPYAFLEKTLKDFQPDYVGVTGTTPMALEMGKIAAKAKELCPSAITVCGGVHVTTFPREMVTDAPFDVAVIGEGDFTLRDLIRSARPDSVPGIAFARGGEVVMTEPRPLVDDLDKLPLPAWQLYDIRRYKTSKLVERESPTGLLETSRGCVFQCTYCNKNIFGRKFRQKSPGRVADEIERMLRLGFREIHIEDDGFSTNLNKAKAICDEIIRRGLKFPWTLINGIRVNRTDEELVRKLKQAGCYQAAFGIESGNQQILDRIQKGITKDQVRKAIAITKKTGIETFGFFMLGLPDETEQTMQDTIDFAVELDLDIAKFAITIPLPGTPLFDEYDEKGLILTKDWSRYLFHDLTLPVYKHPNLDWDTISQYYKKAYRQFYFRPKYALRRLWKGVTTGRIIYDVGYALKTKWW